MSHPVLESLIPTRFLSPSEVFVFLAQCPVAAHQVVEDSHAFCASLSALRTDTRTPRRHEMHQLGLYVLNAQVMAVDLATALRELPARTSIALQAEAVALLDAMIRILEQFGLTLAHFAAHVPALLSTTLQNHLRLIQESPMMAELRHTHRTASEAVCS